MLSKKITMIMVSFFVLLFATGQSAFAAKELAQCKGLDNVACGKKSQCSWVKGYKRKKDGKQVKAFCRAKPNKKQLKKK